MKKKTARVLFPSSFIKDAETMHWVNLFSSLIYGFSGSKNRCHPVVHFVYLQLSLSVLFYRNYISLYNIHTFFKTKSRFGNRLLFSLVVFNSLLVFVSVKFYTKIFCICIPASSQENRSKFNCITYIRNN